MPSRGFGFKRVDFEGFNGIKLYEYRYPKLSIKGLAESLVIEGMDKSRITVVRSTSGKRISIFIGSDHDNFRGDVLFDTKPRKEK